MAFREAFAGFFSFAAVVFSGARIGWFGEDDLHLKAGESCHILHRNFILCSQTKVVTTPQQQQTFYTIRPVFIYVNDKPFNK